MLNNLKTYFKFSFTRKQIINRLCYFFSKKKIVLKYRPLWLLIFVSDLCNLNCKMCPHHTLGNATKFEFLKKEKTFMKPDVFKAIIKSFPEATLVMFAGVGEPLLNPHFFELSEIAVRNKKIINLVTNGILLNKETINKIIKLKRFNQISISLNASNSLDYSNICETYPQTFNKVVENIKQLVLFKKQHKNEAKFEIIVSAICSQEFLPKIKKFLLFADSLGVDRIDIHNYIDFLVTYNKDQWTSLKNNKENERLLKEIKVYTKEKIKAEVRLPMILKEENYSKNCEWFFKNLSFDGAGNISGCGRVINPCKEYGNLFESKEKEDIWNGEYMKKMRIKFLKKDEELSFYCKNCVENYKSNL
jgi:MoaA/NifB/PqqE/SkfB family radical SAM enzyme